MQSFINFFAQKDNDNKKRDINENSKQFFFSN